LIQHRRRRFAVVAAGLLATCAITGCGSAADPATSSSHADLIRIVASTDVYGDIAEQIGGTHVSVTSIIDSPTQDPHSYTASAQDQLALSKADIVIENGGGYDDFIDSMLATAKKSSATVLNAVDISGKTAPHGGDLNEHVWYDLPSMGKLAGRLSAALTATDPGHAADYRATAASFDAKLGQLEKAESRVRAQHAGEAVAITEPVPLYLLQACGLVNKFSHKAVRLLAYNEQTVDPLTERVLAAAKANDVDVVAVTETLPDGTDYVSWMTSNIAAVQRALSS
jgi:zinc/manganese transport system substrate-binding protein